MMKRVIILFAVALVLTLVVMEVQAQITVNRPCDCNGCRCRPFLSCSTWDLARFHSCPQALMVCCMK